MKLYQIPFSHNCVKVRRALEWKGLAYERIDIKPMNRGNVIQATGQWRVPALVDDGRGVSDSTEILLYLEEKYPQKPLLPADPVERNRCLVLEDWADAVFMAAARRLVYWHASRVPDAMEKLFFPESKGVRRWFFGRIARRAVRKRFGLSARRYGHDKKEVLRSAQLAVQWLDGRNFLVGDQMSIADITLAAMTAPLVVAEEGLKADPAVAQLLSWGREILAECYPKEYGWIA